MEFVQPIREKKQIDSMKKILRAVNLRNYCLFVVGINSGLRISDLLKLRIHDVMDSNGRIRDRISIRETKTGKSKSFPIGDTSRMAILEYLNTRTYTRDDPLFLSRKGGQALKRQQAYKIINDAARAVGIEDRIGCHTMRKSFGYHAHQSGVSLAVLQKLFNHSSPSVTLAYIGITQDELDDVYLNLNL